MAQRMRIDIDMYQGDTRAYQFNFFTDTAQQIPWNISSATSIVFSASESFDDSAPSFQTTLASSQANQNGNNWAAGIVVFNIPATSSELLTRNGKYDVQVNLGSGPVTACFGDINLQRQVNPS